MDIPDLEDTPTAQCEACGGTGQDKGHGFDCEQCAGDGWVLVCGDAQRAQAQKGQA